MASWETVNITASNGTWTRESAEIIAEKSNGTVQMAYADLGVELIDVNYWYIHQTFDTTVNDVPMVVWGNSDLVMVGFSIGGYYGTTLKFGVLRISGTTASYATGFGGGDGGCTGTMNILQGDGFTAFKQTGNSSGNNGYFVYNEVEDIVNGGTVQAIHNGSALADFDNGVVCNKIIPYSYSIVSQSDGSAYVEVTEPLYGDDDHIYQAVNVYYTFYDYDQNRDKTILINGIKMNRMATSYIYVPTE